MNDDDKQARLDRISRLIHELQYEVERGFMEAEIEEHIRYEFIIPVSRTYKNGFVFCKFETYPMHRDSALGMQINPKPKLSLVPSNKEN